MDDHEHVFGFPGSTSGSKFYQTWFIGLSGCHARDTKHE